MKKCSGGRFCGACQFKVTDGNKLEEKELEQLFAGGQKVCLRIRATKLITSSLRVKLAAHVERFFERLRWKRLAGFCASALLFVSCCRRVIIQGMPRWYGDTLAPCVLEKDRLEPEDTRKGIRLKEIK